MVTVYSRPQCVQCTATYRALDRRSIPYQVVNVEEDPEALERLKGMGYTRAPVVVTDTTHWSGFRPDLISQLTEGSAS